MTRIRLAKRAFFAANRVMILIFLFAGLLEHCLASHLGSKCQHDMDCTDFIKGSTCSMNGYCECAPYFVQYNVTTCLSSQLLGGDCILADQCTMKVANSSCLDGACRCVEGFLQFRKHTCLGPAHPGAVCYSHAHCQMNDKRSHCDFLIPNLFGRCQCTAPAKQYGGMCVGADENAIENDAVDSQTTTYIPKITPPPTVFRPIDLISHYESTTQGKPLTIVEEVVLPAVAEVQMEISKLPDPVISGSSEHAGGEDLTSDNESLDVLNNFQVTSSTSAPTELVQQPVTSDDYPYHIDNEEQLEEQAVVDENKPEAVEESHILSEIPADKESEVASEDSTLLEQPEHHDEESEMEKDQTPTDSEVELESKPSSDTNIDVQQEDMNKQQIAVTEPQITENDTFLQEEVHVDLDKTTEADNQAEAATEQPLNLQPEIDVPMESEPEVSSNQTQQPDVVENVPSQDQQIENEEQTEQKEPVYIEESHSRPSSGMHIPEETPVVDEEAETHIDMYEEMATGNSQENKDVSPAEEELGSGDNTTAEPIGEIEEDSIKPQQQKVTVLVEETPNEEDESAPIHTDETNNEVNTADKHETMEEPQAPTSVNEESPIQEDTNNDQLQQNESQMSASENEQITEQQMVEAQPVEDEVVSTPIDNETPLLVEQNLSEEGDIQEQPAVEELADPEVIAQPAVSENEEHDINEITKNPEPIQDPEFEKNTLVEETPAVILETEEAQVTNDENQVSEQDPKLPTSQPIQEEQELENTNVQTNQEGIENKPDVSESDDVVTESSHIDLQEETTQISEPNRENALPTSAEQNEEEKEEFDQVEEQNPQLENQEENIEIQPAPEILETTVDQGKEEETGHTDENENAQQPIQENSNGPANSQETTIDVQQVTESEALSSEEELSPLPEVSPAPTQELIQETAPVTESHVEEDTLPVRLEDVLPDEFQPIRKIPQELEEFEADVTENGNLETMQQTDLDPNKILQPNQPDDMESNQSDKATSEETISQVNLLSESEDLPASPSKHDEINKNESSEESTQQVHDLEANVENAEHEIAHIASDNNPLASNDQMPNETLMQTKTDENLAPEKESISSGENVIIESNEKIESDTALGADPMQSNPMPETQVVAKTEIETEAIYEDEGTSTTDKLEIEPQLPDSTMDFETKQNADHAPITDAPTPVHPTFDIEDTQHAGATANAETSANELQTGVNTNESEPTESVPVKIESETLATPGVTATEPESDYSEIEQFEQFEDHHLVDESDEPEPVAVDLDLEKASAEPEPQETTINPLTVKVEDDLKAAENPQFDENESVLSILNGLMAEETADADATTIRPEQPVDDLNAEGTANNEQTPAGNLYYPTILSELLMGDSSDESNLEEATTPVELLDKDEDSAQTIAPEELPFDLSFVASNDREELLSDNLVVETTPDPYNNDEKFTTEIPNILEITTQTMLGLASRVTLMEPAAPIATTLKPFMPIEDDFSTTPSSQMSTDSFLNSKQEIRKRVELGNGPVSLGLRCNNDRQCQLADPYTVCNEQGICDCASKRAAQIQCSAERTGCSPGTFQCRSSGVCISWFFVCDGRPDCTDASDEECTFNARLNQTCPSEAFRCEHSGRCISRAALCDGIKQCPHGEDEIECDSLRTESGQCPPNTFRCNSGECLPEYEYCNAIISCKDGSDEPPHLCGSRSVPNIFLRLLTAAVVDGASSSSKSDSSRTNVAGTNAYCPHRCSNGRCRSTAIVCSGRDGCGDGTDEETCSVCRCPAPAYISAPAEFLAQQPPMPLWK